MQRFTDLKVWQRAHALVLKLYPLLASFPGDERFVLTPQLRRAAISVPSNIAEGSKRRSRHEYAHFLNIAEASLAESEYLIMLARDLGYASHEQAQEFLSDIDELARMLSSLRAKVEDAADVGSGDS